MAEIYIEEKKDKETQVSPTFTEDLREIGLSFANAVRDSVANVFSTFGIAGISTGNQAESRGLIAVIQNTYTPLSAYAFMAFVLLYMPCLVVAIAMKHEFGTWKWFGIAFVYEIALAWIVAFVIYQGGTLLGLGG